MTRALALAVALIACGEPATCPAPLPRETTLVDIERSCVDTAREPWRFGTPRKWYADELRAGMRNCIATKEAAWLARLHADVDMYELDRDMK